MIDTTTVNYALDKVTQAWQAAAPQIANVSEQYVEFVVMKAVLACGIMAFFLLFSASLCAGGVRAGKKYEEKNPGDNDNPAHVLIAIGGLGFVVFSITFAICAYQMLLALHCPEMFTINRLIVK